MRRRAGPTDACGWRLPQLSCPVRPALPGEAPLRPTLLLLLAAACVEKTEPHPHPADDTDVASHSDADSDTDVLADTGTLVDTDAVPGDDDTDGCPAFTETDAYPTEDAFFAAVAELICGVRYGCPHRHLADTGTDTATDMSLEDCIAQRTASSPFRHGFERCLLDLAAAKHLIEVSTAAYARCLNDDSDTYRVQDTAELQCAFDAFLTTVDCPDSGAWL